MLSYIALSDGWSQGSIDARVIARRMNCMTSSTCSSGTGIITYGIAYSPSSLAA